jgi:sortase A
MDKYVTDSGQKERRRWRLQPPKIKKQKPGILDMALPGRIWHYAERALLLTGLALLASYAAGVIDSELGRYHGLTAFADARADAAAALIAPAHFSDVNNRLLTQPDRSLWSATRIEAFEASLDLAVGLPGGILQIPAIDLVVPIFEGAEQLALNRGVGRIENTALIGTVGNIGIAGHRDGFFRGLKDLGVGDLIEVEALTGTNQYRVSEIRIVDPSEVSVLAPTDEPILTLVTCYPFYFVGHAPQRYIVRAVLADQTSASET